MPSAKGSGPGTHGWSAASRAKKLRTMARRSFSQKDADWVIEQAKTQYERKDRPISRTQVQNILQILRSRRFDTTAAAEWLGPKEKKP